MPFYYNNEEYKAIYKGVSAAAAWLEGTLSGDIDLSGSSLTAMQKNAFKEVPITSVKLPSSLSAISDYCFSKCTSLVSVDIPSNVSSLSIGGYAFNECDHLTSITLPYNLTTLGTKAFYKCSRLQSVEFPRNMTPIRLTGLPSSCFELCTSLVSLDIPEGPTSIGASAIDSCTSLKTLVLPSTITTIGNYFLYKCTALESVTIKATTPPSLGSSPFIYLPSTCIIYVPAESVSAYQSASGWSNKSSQIQAIPTT